MTENIENASVDGAPVEDDGVVTTDSKIMTILLLGNGDLRTEVKEEFFSEASEDETRSALREIISLSSESIKQESVEIANDSEMASFTTPINQGSLYDDIVFETGIYINSKNQVVTNTSFGKYCNPDDMLKDTLARVSETIKHVAEHLEEGHVHGENDNSEQQPKPIENVNVSDRIKERF